MVERFTALQSLVKQTSNVLSANDILAALVYGVNEAGNAAKLSYHSHELNRAILKYSQTGEIDNFAKWWAIIEERESWLDDPLSIAAGRLQEDLLTMAKKLLADPQLCTEGREGSLVKMMDLAKEVTEVSPCHCCVLPSRHCATPCSE